MESVRVAVVGGGQAGLSVSRELTERAVEHVVLERGRVGQTWRNRWNSFRLVTPNWAVQLPGGAYAGPDPDGFMARSEIVAFLEGYATSVGAPIREGVGVTAIERRGDAFRLRTTDGEVRADVVVLSTGAYQRPHRPAAAADIPSDVPRLDIDDYREPSELPDGRILIVGAGQSGCQVAEELHAAGREVVLSCGRAPWVTRRYGDRDVVWWMIRSGFMDRPLSSLPDPSARLWSNPLTSGHRGGHDLHLRTLRAIGVTLVGRLIGVDGHTARFAPDLADSVAWGDEWYRMFKRLVIDTATTQELESPRIADPEPFDPSAPDELDLRDVGAVLFAGGFRPDYRSWLPWGEAFDSDGFPLHHEGASTVVPGLYFVGVHFLRTRKSSLLYGVGEDAAIVAGSIEHPRRRRTPSDAESTSTPERRYGSPAMGAMDKSDPGYKGYRGYNRFMLAVYDPWVLGFMARAVWKVPVPRGVEQYRNNLGRRHLDVGPGTGYFLEKAAPPAGTEITLLDPNPNVLARCSRRLASLHPETIQASVMEPLPLDPTFDSAALNFVLHCLRGPMSNKAAAIRNIATVLEPDGVLFGGTVLGISERHTPQARLVLKAFNKAGDFDNLGDTSEGLRGILEESFQEVEIDVIGSAAFFTASRLRR